MPPEHDGGVSGDRSAGEPEDPAVGEPDDHGAGEREPFVRVAELRRRLVHVSGAAVPLSHLLAPALVPWSSVTWFAVAGAVLAGVLEVLRLSGRLDWRIYDELTREYEADNPAGYALYAVGMATVAVLFSPPVAAPAMLMLAVGDPISGMLGSAGAEGIKQGYVLAAMFGVCLALAAPFVPQIGLPAAVAGAVLATVADGVKPVVAGYVLDDNVTIPVGAAAAMWLVGAALAV